MIYLPLEDSTLLETQVKKYSKNKTVLDVGSGTGIQAQAALKSSAKSVIATDISPQAISILKSKNIPCINSDLFSKIIGSFDLIIFNPPYLPIDKREPIDSMLATTGGKRGDEILLRFLKKAPQHLNSKGTILIVLSSLTPKIRINKLVKSLNLGYKIIASKKLFFENLEVWEIKMIN